MHHISTIRSEKGLGTLHDLKQFGNGKIIHCWDYKGPTDLTPPLNQIKTPLNIEVPLNPVEIPLPSLKTPLKSHDPPAKSH